MSHVDPSSDTPGRTSFTPSAVRRRLRKAQNKAEFQAKVESSKALTSKLSRKELTQRATQIKVIENMINARLAAQGSFARAFPGDAHALMTYIYKSPEFEMGTRLEAAKAAIRFEKRSMSPSDGSPEEFEKGTRGQHTINVNFINASHAEQEKVIEAVVENELEHAEPRTTPALPRFVGAAKPNDKA